MLLTITTTHNPATDLGFLLHKHPDKLQTVDLPVGKGHLFYPESAPEKTTIALLLEIDSVEMVKKARNITGSDFSLAHYVNDRPYVASSFMSVAISKAFSTAMKGRCKDKPELVDVPMPFEASINVLPAPDGGEDLIRRLFEPLGYTVHTTPHILDDKFPDWGYSKYYTVQLSNTLPVKELLAHLYVLIPALDNVKHYFVEQSEIKKLLNKGEGWLKNHPEKEEITRRYLINLKSYTREALEKLNEGEEEPTTKESSANKEAKAPNLNQQRLNLAKEQIKKTGAETVIDLGCGEGKLLKLLFDDPQFSRIAGMDVSYNELAKAKEQLRLEELPPQQKERIYLFQGALTYRDKRLEGYDAAALVEVIEHLDESRLQALERVVFECACPHTVVVSTPNAEYNAMFDSMDPGESRHADHRFEWSREQFQEWANGVAERNHYSVSFLPVGKEDQNAGAPSQMAVFIYGN